MRFDQFLSRVGIVKRRTEAARLLREGRVVVDRRIAKPATLAEAGQHLRIELPRFVREYEILDVPRGNVPKSNFDQYARMMSETARETPDQRS